MKDKKVFDLTEDDFGRCHVWFFPMDETVEDELTVRPFLGSLDEDYQKIIGADFTGADGSKYFGYLYYDLSASGVEYTKPVIFYKDKIITFWNGMIKPSWFDYPNDIQEVKNSLPIGFRSRPAFNLSLIEGELRGLYYLDENNRIKISSE